MLIDQIVEVEGSAMAVPYPAMPVRAQSTSLGLHRLVVQILSLMYGRPPTGRTLDPPPFPMRLPYNLYATRTPRAEIRPYRRQTKMLYPQPTTDPACRRECRESVQSELQGRVLSVWTDV